MVKKCKKNCGNKLETFDSTHPEKEVAGFNHARIQTVIVSHA